MSYVDSTGHVFSSAEELEIFLKATTGEADSTDLPMIMCAQTTQKLQEWEKCQKIIKKYYY